MTNWIKWLDDPISLHSGDKSHWFIDGEEIYLDDRLREAVLDCWVRALQPSEPRHESRAWCAVGVPRGGVAWAETLATRLGAPNTYTSYRPEETLDEQRYRYALVDDVVTTGSSIMVRGPWTRRLAVVVRNSALHYWLLPHVTAWAWLDLDRFPVDFSSRSSP